MRESHEEFPRRLAPELALRIALLKERKRRERRNRRRARPRTDRERMVITMVRSRCTYREIGDALGVVPGRACVIVQRIRRQSGDGVFVASKQRFWTIAEAARDLGVPSHTIQRICRRGEISCFWRGAEGKQYLITDDGMEQLRADALAMRTHARTCVICSTPFTVDARKGNWTRSTCGSSACRRALRESYRQKILAQIPTEESFTGWMRAVFRALQRHRPTGRTEWITRSEAIRRTGLSRMQVGWLLLRRVLTVRPHPTRRWHGGRPVATVAASEIAIVRKVYAAYMQRRMRG